MSTGVLVAQGFLHTSGTKIMNGTGEEVILRGIGLGGWLVPEGYMLHTSGFASSPTEIKTKIIALVGQAGADQFYQAYRKNYVTRKDVDSIARWGFNSIRLPMHYELLTPKGQIGTFLPEGFALIDSLLGWCEANHLYLILDLHCAPGGQNTANISDYSGSPTLWESTVYQQQTVALWKEIARRYANKQWIGGYDLLNETVWTFSTTPANKPLWDLYIAITSAIRTVDANHIIYIEGNQWANDFSGVPAPWDNNLVFSFHKYWNPNVQGEISGYLKLSADNNVPLWCGEAGENSNQWFSDCIALFEQNHIGWSWWPHKKIESNATLLSSPITPGYDSLLQFWNNQLPQPNAQAALYALNSQALSLNIDQCKVRRDVIDAILRQPFTNATVPFSNSKIPGTVFASEYDMGKNGIAYGDIDFQNISRNSGGASWNSGGIYRNDGVDIERCTDFPTDGYDVGWINAGEFLTFTVNVAETADYDVSIRYAANAAGGMVRLQMDGLYISEYLTFPSTGGWQTWKSFNAGQYALTVGKHLFGISFLTGGFNLNHFKFTKSATHVSGQPEIIQEYQLQQNYPNPFNPTTVIEYQLPGEGTRFSVSLKVYDMLGREVMQFVSEKQDAGRHQIMLNARGWASGIYLYRLTAIDEENNQHTFQKKMLLLK
jgi:aryl-phospho-beta-D-glucosidase BglC (GH1 family)